MQPFYLWKIHILFFFLQLLLCSTSHLLSILLVEKARLPHLHPRKKVSSMRCSNQSPATTAVIGTLLELNYIASRHLLIIWPVPGMQLKEEASSCVRVCIILTRSRIKMSVWQAKPDASMVTLLTYIGAPTCLYYTCKQVNNKK